MKGFQGLGVAGKGRSFGGEEGREAVDSAKEGYAAAGLVCSNVNWKPHKLARWTSDLGLEAFRA